MKMLGRLELGGGGVGSWYLKLSQNTFDVLEQVECNGSRLWGGGVQRGKIGHQDYVRL